MSRILWAASVLLFSCGSSWADVESGPTVGEKTPALKVRVVTNGQPAEPADLVKERADNPTVYVVLPADKFDRPAARYLKGVDAAVSKLQKTQPNAGLTVIWLAEDTDAGAKRITQIQGSLQLTAGTWAVCPSTSPEGWSIHERAAVTAVVATKGAVTARFGYDSVNENDVAKLEAALKPLGGQ
ncbi:MAG: hypothetical protein SH850_30485 [Planctomycetaceae bacterium]|nr:hypothetical protein [Planctomycetaceae bacterium]